MPDDLEQRLAEAVQAVASTPLGEATQTFLDVEELFVGFLFFKIQYAFLLQHVFGVNQKQRLITS